MPVFNAERTVAGAINSILTQTFQDWELIVVNDGSLDTSEDVIKRFKDKRIRYFRREHKGMAETNNFGNEKASGKYCIVHGADDYSFPNRLERIIEVFQERDPDVVIHGIYLNSWNGQYKCPNREYRRPMVGFECVLKNQINGVPAYKKEVWEKRPFRKDTTYAYDWMMHLDWYLSGFEYEVLNEGLYDYIRYQGSASDRFEKSGERQKAFELIKKIVKKEYGVKIKT